MLKLRRGLVVAADPLTVEIDGEQRRAWADPALIGPVELGDDVVVNTEALDLGLGSGGFDVVHVNLTRGLAAGGSDGEHVIKLNYSSLQHPVGPVEEFAVTTTDTAAQAESRPALVAAIIPLHGYLAPLAWAAQVATPGLQVGYIQSFGGALPASLSKVVGEMRGSGLLSGHISAGPCYGAEHEAISVIGGLDAAAGLGWDAAIVGPGPGILGSATRFGHGGMAALDNAHAAIALGLETVVAPRLSSGDERERHRGLSHHTATVLENLLGSAVVPVPEPPGDAGDAVEAYADLKDVCKGRHRIQLEGFDLAAYLESGLPARTMGRDLEHDELFFAAALASGATLGRLVNQARREHDEED